ncbi:ferrous iron transport protein A [Desulfobaculum xiamenense]|uniref:Ferrous iron transport protein A n=1 Tax=Desulfobaculum xiamenense TaxID=995050 RepID=A0A846QI22_9BACT|nr:ferrous iron transport protein A [Desulfobaculum xiamenense]
MTISEIRVCPRERCRVLAMGLTPGTVAEICSNGPGSCCLRVRDCDLVLGDGMARHILATLVSDMDSRTA